MPLSGDELEEHLEQVKFKLYDKVFTPEAALVFAAFEPGKGPDDYAETAISFGKAEPKKYHGYYQAVDGVQWVYSRFPCGTGLVEHGLLKESELEYAIRLRDSASNWMANYYIAQAEHPTVLATVREFREHYRKLQPKPEQELLLQLGFDDVEEGQDDTHRTLVIFDSPRLLLPIEAGLRMWLYGCLYASGEVPRVLQDTFTHDLVWYTLQAQAMREKGLKPPAGEYYHDLDLELEDDSKDDQTD